MPARQQASPLKSAMIWGLLALALGIPVLAAANSPYLAYRQPIYILAGFSGILGLCLLLVQPLLAGGFLPGLTLRASRRIHRATGALLVAAVLLHVGGLWITSPPDAIDALLLRSPTPFSVWGVAAMWAVFAAALLAGFRKRLKLRPRSWGNCHTGLAAVIALGTIIHAILIEGTMETTSKAALCLLVALALLKTVANRFGKRR